MKARGRRRPARARRDGLTLLEVLLSLTIFLFALVAIGSLFTWGHDRGADARDKTQALRLAQSKLAEVVSGVQALSAQAETPYDLFPGFYWTLDCNQNGVTNLWDVQVTVARKRDQGRSVQVTLAQMVLDPSQRGTTIPAQGSTGSSSSSSSGTTSSGSP